MLRVLHFVRAHQIRWQSKRPIFLLGVKLFGMSLRWWSGFASSKGATGGIAKIPDPKLTRVTATSTVPLPLPPKKGWCSRQHCRCSGYSHAASRVPNME